MRTCVTGVQWTAQTLSPPSPPFLLLWYENEHDCVVVSFPDWYENEHDCVVVSFADCGMRTSMIVL